MPYLCDKPDLKIRILMINNPLTYDNVVDTLGGLNGYVSGTLISKTKTPPSYAVSGGPVISPLSSV